MSISSMQLSVLLLIISSYIVNIETTETIKYSSSCSVPSCSHPSLSSSHTCYRFHTANNSVICGPLFRCSAVKECTKRNTCASKKEVCIINSCCSKPICMPLALAASACPTADLVPIQITRQTTTRTTTLQPTSMTSRCTNKEVHVIGIYEATSDHFFRYHPVKDVTVRLERPGEQVLVLSAYEPIRWHIQLANNVQLRAVHLIGYHEQTVAPLDNNNISISTAIGSSGACGYSFPANDGGCDTNKVLALARKYVGGEITSFHGCYQASKWTIDENFRATSNCATQSGYEQYSYYPDCQASEAWRPNGFTILGTPSCNGKRYIRLNTKYNLWIGAILCNTASRYKLYLSDAVNSTFLEIADYSGHGNDHCELVNPAFGISNGDDITGDGCTQCSLGETVDIQDVEVYARASYGQPFRRTKSRFWGDLTTNWYECGVNIP